MEIGGGHQGWWTTAKSLKKASPHPFACGVIQKTLAQTAPHKLWGGLSGLSLQKAQALGKEQNRFGEGQWSSKNKKLKKAGKRWPNNPQVWEDWAEWQRDDEPVDGASDLRRLEKRALEREGLPVPQWLLPQPPLKVLAEQKKRMRELINKAKAMQEEAQSQA